MKSIFCHKAKAAPPAAKTLRFEFSNQSYSPVTAGVGSSGTWKRCEFMPGNVWDWTTTSSASLSDAFVNTFNQEDNSVEVIAAGDMSGITAMARTFRNCSSLKSICLFNTANVNSFRACFSGCSSLEELPTFNTQSATSLYETFSLCTSLKRIPLFDTSSAIDVTSMFNGCINVEGGALELYQQASTQGTPPTITTNCFKNCGNNTETGAAELAQIPVSWGGTKEEP